MKVMDRTKPTGTRNLTRELEPIPTPWRHRWRELRMRVLPAVVFAVTAGIVGQLWTERLARANLQSVVVGTRVEREYKRIAALREDGVPPETTLRPGEIVEMVLVRGWERSGCWSKCFGL